MLFMIATGVVAFTVPCPKGDSTMVTLSMVAREEDVNNARRSFVSALGVLAPSLFTAAANAAQEPEYRQGIEVNAFNGLIFNYRNSQFGGLAASDLNEPSVSYQEFCQKLKDGQVEFVEFLAPDGDVAYATFKAAKEGEAPPAPIRIGEGYPIEQHDGWSSPAFAVRTVKNAGVPYKFTVPGLAKYSTSS